VLVATTDGIFYVNQNWTMVICFDPFVANRYKHNAPNLQVRICDLKSPTLKRDLRNAKYYFKQDMLLIEFDHIICLVKIVFSNFDVTRVSNVSVQTMPKDGMFNFNLLSPNNGLGSCLSSTEIFLYKFDTTFCAIEKPSMTESRSAFTRC
jgi:hypothetical protein